MSAAVHFGEDFNWGREEEKSLRGHARRSESKAKRKAMAEADEDKLRLVLSTMLDEKFHDAVLEVYESKEWTIAVFDSMVKQAQINTEHHLSRSEQLAEFRKVWPNISSKGKSTFDDSFAAIGLLFEKRFFLVDSESSSEDEEKARRAASAKTKFSSKWFSINETEDMLKDPVAKLVVQNLQGNFTARKPIFDDSLDGVNSKEAAAKNQGSAEDDRGSKRKVSTKQSSTQATVLQRESSKEDEEGEKMAPTKNSRKRRLTNT